MTFLYDSMRSKLSHTSSKEWGKLREKHMLALFHAAAIFPLTQRSDLSKSLGTRHRAAIGLSEETDAIIVVVSEESGLISYAYKGQLTRGVTLQELRAFLSSIILRPEKTHGLTKWVRAQFTERNRPKGPAVITKHEPRKFAGK